MGTLGSAGERSSVDTAIGFSVPLLKCGSTPGAPEEHIDVIAQQIAERGAAALVGNVRQLGARLQRQRRGCQVAGRAGSGRCIVEPLRALLALGHHLLHRVEGGGGMGRQDQGRVAHQHYGQQVFRLVVQGRGQ